MRPLSADALLALQKQMEERTRQRARRRENRAKRQDKRGLHARDEEFAAISRRLGGGGDGGDGDGGDADGEGEGIGGGKKEPYYYEPEDR